jgi:peptide deformylase
MIAITYWKETKKGHERIDEDIMINPEIIEKSNEMLVSEEACLSVPDVI